MGFSLTHEAKMISRIENFWKRWESDSVEGETESFWRHKFRGGRSPINLLLR